MEPRHSPLRQFTCLAAAILFGCGGYFAGRRAYADRLAASSEAARIERAVELLPGTAKYWVRRADLLDRDLQSPTAALLHAAALNPSDADVWIRLGLDAEVRADFPRAEKYLLRAADVSRRFQPRWALANYYFRRGSSSDFWKWTRLALELEPPDPDAVFQLCWRMPVPAAEIFTRAIPPQPKLWRDYTRFLLAHDHLDAAVEVLQRILPNVQSGDRDLLLDAADHFLAAHDAVHAGAAWNALCARKLADCEAGDPHLIGRGFAWRPVEAPGIALDLRSGGLSAEFSGKQPENAEIVWRWVAVEPTRRGRLRFEYQTSDISPSSGLTWQILADGVAAPLASSPSLSSAAWTEAQLPIETPPRGDLVRLRLNYSRPPGSVRIEGSLEVRALRIEWTQ